MDKGSAQSTVPSVRLPMLLNCDICFPPIPEQRLIATFLDAKCAEIDALTTDIQTQIDTLEQYKRSIITEAVTKGLNPDAEIKDSGIEFIGEIPANWIVSKIKYLGKIRNGLTYTPNDICDQDEGILVLRSSNIKGGKITFNDNVYVSCPVKKDLMVRPGDILICSRNGSRELIGKNALIEDITATFGAFMMILRCQRPKYMYYILNSSIFSYYLGTFFTSTIHQLTGANFGNMVIPYSPSVEECNQIVAYLDAKCTEIDDIITQKREQINTIEEYKKSLIFEYVTGKKEVV